MPIASDWNEWIHHIPTLPGVYRMLDDSGKVIYVGKARNLKQRVRSYFGAASGHSIKTRQLMLRTASVETTVTNTENEALILESNLIKEHRPRYNILFRDDKAFPWLRITLQHEFPRISYYRGAQRKGEKYLGPFPDAAAAKKTLYMVQKLFRLRTCKDSMFAHRSRPCLQYQIGRCTAPCVGYIPAREYRDDLNNAMLLLTGKKEELEQAITAPMQKAVAALDFERAAQLRDQLAALRKIQEKQQITSKEGDADVLYCLQEKGGICVEIMTIRGGLNLGSRGRIPQCKDDCTAEELMAACIAQFYLNKGIQIPAQLLVNVLPEEVALLESALTERAGHKVTIRQPLRGRSLQWLQMTQRNACFSLQQRSLAKKNAEQGWYELQQLLQLSSLPQRIECFDISHTQGEATVASCVVFDLSGAVRDQYRNYTIKTALPGDDCHALAEAVQRRYRRQLDNGEDVPDIVLVDGGKAQLRAVAKVMRLFHLDIRVLSVVKGEGRRAENDRFLSATGGQELKLPPHSPVLHLLQRIRDEAHRFALRGHRRSRAKKGTRSSLENIAGIGKARRQALLRYFGGISGVVQAGVRDFSSVPGINKALAQRLYNHFHEET